MKEEYGELTYITERGKKNSKSKKIKERFVAYRHNKVNKTKWENKRFTTEPLVVTIRTKQNRKISLKSHKVVQGRKWLQMKAERKQRAKDILQDSREATTIGTHLN